ncbi:VSG-associated, congolense-specific ORF [Trypanosoma congolense IL3000]|uniref:VSG-associated, congolense-specific ORF n=1 Tax=Trypanosoma congolense (strain IL3000) TaxID=1068625 RepID=F9W7T8_TRYCI|nr:VSG-associated, congolense-specific ORF [Trypanosoma congolense IL3000]
MTPPTLFPFCHPFPIPISPFSETSIKIPMSFYTITSPRTIPWSMEKDVVEVLLDGVAYADKINLYWFLRPVLACLPVDLVIFTLRDFVRNPRHCIPAANVCDALWQYLPYILWKFRQSATPLVKHFGPTQTWTKWHWDPWKIYYDMDDMPLEAIDEEIWRRCRRPPPPPYQPYQEVVVVEAAPAFIQVPYPTVGYLVHLPVTPRAWTGL